LANTPLDQRDEDRLFHDGESAGCLFSILVRGVDPLSWRLAQLERLIGKSTRSPTGDSDSTAVLAFFRIAR